MKDLTLYEIADSIRAILCAEDWTDETVSALEQCELSLTEKVGSIIEIIRQADAQAEMCKAEETRIAAMRRSREKKAEWLRSYLMTSMDAIGRTEIAIGTRTVRIKENPVSVGVDDESLISPRFFTIIPESKQLDKAALKEELKKGEIPGAHLFRTRKIEVK